MAKTKGTTPKTDRIAKGNTAKGILNDPVVVEALENLKDYYLNQWKNSNEAETDKRERVYLSLRTLEDVIAELESFVTSGKIATNEQ